MKTYIKQLRSTIFLRVLTDGLYVISIAAIPYIIKSLMDYDYDKGLKGILLMVLLYLLAVGSGMVFQYITQYHAWLFRKKFFLMLKGDIFNKVVNFSQKEFEDQDIGAYISMLDNEVGVVEQYYDSGVNIVQSSINILVYGIYMFIMDPLIALAIIFVSCLTLFLPNITSKELSSRRGKHLKATGHYYSLVKDLLSGFSQIDYKTRSGYQREHRENLEKTEEAMMAYGAFNTFVNVFNGFFMYLLDIAAFALVGILLVYKQISIGVAMATLVYIKEFVYPIRYLISDISRMKSAKGTRDKLESFVSKPLTDLPLVEKFEETICFKGVKKSFGDLTIGPLTLEIQKGKKYVIVGESGSGKSSLIKLLTKKINMDQGTISIDGQNLNGVNPEGLISYISQFEHIFKTSSMNNTSFFSSYQDSQVDQALDDLKSDKLRGLMASEDASVFSGGEKQLLALVRLLVRQREILILDEPFASLDPDNRRRFEDMVYGLENKTMLVITHQLREDMVHYFDHVLYMTKGQVQVKEVLEGQEVG